MSLFHGQLLQHRFCQVDNYSWQTVAVAALAAALLPSAVAAVAAVAGVVGTVAFVAGTSGPASSRRTRLVPQLGREEEHTRNDDPAAMYTFVQRQRRHCELIAPMIYSMSSAGKQTKRRLMLPK